MTRFKLAVIALAALAVTKVAVQEHLYRSGTRDVLVTAYRDRAIAACQKDPRNQTLAASSSVWSRPTEIRVVIGKTDLNVWFWQIDHALWSARYRNPYLHIASTDRYAGVACEYDIVHGIANLTRG
jgi:hypothetical protein